MCCALTDPIFYSALFLSSFFGGGGGGGGEGRGEARGGEACNEKLLFSLTLFLSRTHLFQYLTFIVVLKCLHVGGVASGDMYYKPFALGSWVCGKILCMVCAKAFFFSFFCFVLFCFVFLW